MEFVLFQMPIWGISFFVFTKTKLLSFVIDIQTTSLLLLTFFHQLKANHYANDAINQDNQDQILKNKLLNYC